MTEAEYRKAPGMNVSLLVSALKSLRQLKWDMEHPRERTPAMRRGTMGHCYLLEPGEFRNRYVEIPAFEMDDLNCTDSGKPSTSKATKYYKSRLAEFMSQFAGAELITDADREFCVEAARSVMSEPNAAKWITSSDTEVVMFGEIEGVACKARLDIVNRKEDMIVDLKFTRDVQPHVFGSQSSKLKIPFRMAFYREIARQNGIEATEVKIIAVENEGPYDCVVYPIREAVLDSEFDRVCSKLREVKRARETGDWTGVSRGEELELVIPMYDMPEDETLVEWSEAS